MISLFLLPKMHTIGKIKYRTNGYILAFNIGVAYIVIQIILGVMQGFGKSPYDHTPIGIVTNLIRVSIPLIIREWVRHYLVNGGIKYKVKGIIPLVVIGMTAITIRSNEWIAIRELQSFTLFAANTLLPTLSEQTLASYLVLYAGPWASLIYLGLVEGFEWLSPILPDASWLLKGVVGMFVPTVGTLVLSEQYTKWMRRTKLREQKAFNFYQYLGAATLSVLFIWFVVGVFPIYPSAIATGSMQPMIDPGDVVLVRKIQEETQLNQLQIGDVIQFQKENILINHRIIDIAKDDQGTRYQTKGDNNSAPDTDWVTKEQIKGTLVKVIPKIGWPTLMLKNSQKTPPVPVEF